jgi:hypothetical protein
MKPKKEVAGKTKITLGGRAPVLIINAEWPKIASASEFDSIYEANAHTVWNITVREHADGRRIVYGSALAGPNGAHLGFKEFRTGTILHKVGSIDLDTIRVIAECATLIGKQGLSQTCIATLPAVELK